MDDKSQETPLFLSPKVIRFTHNSIYNTFRDGRRVFDLADQLEAYPQSIAQVPTIRVVYHRGCYWSLDNRRLFAFKVADLDRVPVTIETKVTVHSIVNVNRE
jgi:hypothetical protein